MATPKKKIITKAVKPTDEEKIFNNAEEDIITKRIYDVFNKNVTYNVYNLQLGNNPTLMCGTMIEQFFGYNDMETKEALETGAKHVTIYEMDNEGNRIPLYRIEVVE